MVETYRKSWENWDLGFIGIFMGYLMMIWTENG
jgi:zinc transporter ZupT